MKAGGRFRHQRGGGGAPRYGLQSEPLASPNEPGGTPSRRKARSLLGRAFSSCLGHQRDTRAVVVFQAIEIATFYCASGNGQHAQGREQTTAPILSHAANPADCVFNLAALRPAYPIKRLRARRGTQASQGVEDREESPLTH
jgi:hypothetical protein